MTNKMIKTKKEKEMKCTTGMRMMTVGKEKEYTHAHTRFSNFVVRKTYLL